MNKKLLFEQLNEKIDGEVLYDNLHRIIYATDASAYREMPLLVTFPKNTKDIVQIVKFANENNLNIIPRAAGTSLAGQVVGNGLILDVSKHMTSILELNQEEKWIRVQPGVVLDQLNLFLKPYGLFFGPETSTANRCCIGGMLGNNSCGSHSVVYRATREHTIESEVVLSDASLTTFKHLSQAELDKKLNANNLEAKIYQKLYSIVSNKELVKEIEDSFPEKALTRRNTAYALDEIKEDQFDLTKLLVGSEGTLAIATDIKLSLVDLPPKEKALVCVHCETLEESFHANLIALKHTPVAVELMDKNILELSAKNIEQKANRFFIKGNPDAILMVELAFHTREELDEVADEMEEDLRTNGFYGHCSRVYGKDIFKVWSLRKAGLGLLSNMPGSAKPVSVIEDTAVVPEKLPAYMKEFKQLMDQYNLSCVYHAHIGTGELHLRPILDLKKKKDKELFHTLAKETALLVKKYRGSLSGEHGDGRLRGEFIPLMFGETVYNLMCEVKDVFDPKGILNPNKIVNTPSMNTSLRYDGDYKDVKVDTYFDFSAQKGWLSAIEQCNGSGDCRKGIEFGGTMCPSYRATGDEKNTTRARANTLRELLSRPQSSKIFSQPEILEALELCVSCKACKSECPSNVDMTRLKAEFMQHHYDENSVGYRTWLVAFLPQLQACFSKIPFLYNMVVNNSLSSTLLKKILKFAPQRSLPPLSKMTLRSFAKRYSNQEKGKNGKVYLFADEFTNHMEAEIGTKFIELLSQLGYEVEIPKHIESGRTALSKGLLKKAKKIANRNVNLLKDIVTDNEPLIGIEPSCILSFRDEYPDLVDNELKEGAKKLAKSSFLFDEFLLSEIKKGKIVKEQFSSEPLKIFLHGHCHQKSLASVEASRDMLSLPQNYEVEMIPSGCCGMAGAFGYEKKNYDLSMAMGEQVLFPYVRKATPDIQIAAPGTSCRQQIFDGTGRQAKHPIEILFKALK
ncbi:FAD-linked oxidase C-terminal domain-containing protein [Marinifilum fragile]|uniref:FAD-binding and (Fe-S)-binding domain-containing protein n=1 Tax=Marinifilum fragile TaxID=570161 RepID=UPI002AA69F5E|nr:FAD-linked oxidase C-terminal domain-containing protein [Marinifilum fragile]